MEKLINNLCECIEGFHDMKRKYDELQVTYSGTINQFKEILKEEIGKITDKLEGKIH